MVEKREKKNPERFRVYLDEKTGKQMRACAYDPDLGHGFRFVLEADVDKVTEDQQDEAAMCITKSLLAREGILNHREEIEALENEIQFRVVRGGRFVLLPKDAQEMLLRGVHWGIAQEVALRKTLKDKGLDFEVLMDGSGPKAVFIGREYSDKLDG